MIPAKQDQLQQKEQKRFKSKQYPLGIDGPTFSFLWKLWNSYLFLTYRIYAKNFYVFLFILCSKLLKIKKCAVVDPQ